jgi:truncated hemoglobin YjbI
MAQKALAHHTITAHNGKKHMDCAECQRWLKRVDDTLNGLTEAEVKALVRAYERREIKVK